SSPGSPRRLAPGADVGSPASLPQQPDRRAAARAGFAGASVDLEGVLRPGFLDVGDLRVALHVLLRQGEIQPATDGGGEAVPLPRGEGPDRPAGVNPGTPQRLGGMDVSQAGDPALVHQGNLDGGAGVAEGIAELLSGEGREERVRSERLDRGELMEP